MSSTVVYSRSYARRWHQPARPDRNNRLTPVGASWKACGCGEGGGNHTKHDSKGAAAPVVVDGRCCYQHLDMQRHLDDMYSSILDCSCTPNPPLTFGVRHRSTFTNSYFDFQVRRKVALLLPPRSSPRGVTQGFTSGVAMEDGREQANGTRYTAVPQQPFRQACAGSEMGCMM